MHIRTSLLFEADPALIEHHLQGDGKFELILRLECRGKDGRQASDDVLLPLMETCSAAIGIPKMQRWKLNFPRDDPAAEKVLVDQCR